MDLYLKGIQLEAHEVREKLEQLKQANSLAKAVRKGMDLIGRGTSMTGEAAQAAGPKLYQGARSAGPKLYQGARSAGPKLYHGARSAGSKAYQTAKAHPVKTGIGAAAGGVAVGGPAYRQSKTNTSLKGLVDSEDLKGLKPDPMNQQKMMTDNTGNSLALLAALGIPSAAAALLYLNARDREDDKKIEEL